jgi:hypothetical protein
MYAYVLDAAGRHRVYLQLVKRIEREGRMKRRAGIHAAAAAAPKRACQASDGWPAIDGYPDIPLYP